MSHGGLLIVGWIDPGGERSTRWLRRATDEPVRPGCVSGGEYPFRCFLVVGTATDCAAALVALHKEFAKP